MPLRRVQVVLSLQEVGSDRLVLLAQRKVRLMPTIIQKRGWSVRIRYAKGTGRARSFIAFAEGPIEYSWFDTRRKARAHCAESGWKKTHAFPVRATLTLKVEDR